MTNPHQEFSDDHTPKAYLITFRSYGTWLHGDRRGSVDRFHNTYGTPRLPRNLPRERYDRSLMAGPPVRLNAKQRAAIERGIRETCRIRKWALWAFNIRTNHVHSVVTAPCGSKKVLAALKANATRTMRESNCWNSERSPWAYRGSRRSLWNEQQLTAAFAYVLYDQGEPLPEEDE
jgi:REP element-mobilizing transposase RayT